MGAPLHAATLGGRWPQPPSCHTPPLTQHADLRGKTRAQSRTGKQLLQQVQLPALLLQGARAAGARCCLLLRKRLGFLAQLLQNLHVALQHLQAAAVTAGADQC